MSNPASDVATEIDTNVAALTLNTNLFAHEMRPPGGIGNIPQEAVFCLQTGGPTPERYLDGSTASPQIRRPVVQVLVRSKPWDFSGGQTLARQVKDAIHAQSISGYVDVEVRESEPTFLEREVNGCFIWSMNVDLIVEE